MSNSAPTQNNSENGNSSAPSRILKAEEAAQTAFDFNPKKFPVVVPEPAEGFVQENVDVAKTGFRLNELIAEQIGISESEQQKLEEKIDQLAIEKLKEVEEKAYKEAYDLGLDEGRKQAYEDTKSELDSKLAQLENVLRKIEVIKDELVRQNEAHLVKTVASFASQVAMKEIEVDSESILRMVAEATSQAQKGERILVRLSKTDHDFLMEHQEIAAKSIENLESIKFEADQSITKGGCVVETNYGVVDATIEQRVKKLFEIIEERAPTVKDRVG